MEDEASVLQFFSGGGVGQTVRLVRGIPLDSEGGWPLQMARLTVNDSENDNMLSNGEEVISSPLMERLPWLEPGRGACWRSVSAKVGTLPSHERHGCVSHLPT